MARALDVVVPTRNTRDVTLRCLEAMARAGAEAGARTSCFLIDNASADGTAEAVSVAVPGVTVIRNESNLGYGGACNQGARVGSAEFILFLNSDAIARPDSLARLLNFFDGQPGVVAAGGRLVHSGTSEPQVGFLLRAFPTLASQLALLVGLERYWPRNPISRRQLMLDFDYERTQLVAAQPAGACLLCRRAPFESVGGFDEGFYYWFEDVDLVRRLAERGSIGYVHDAVFEHLGGGTFVQWTRAEVVTTRYQSLFRYFEKHHSRPELWTLRVVVFGLSLARVVVLSFFDRARARAYGQVLRLAWKGSA